jgi:serine phosphatase RsbU (regulator of sigma subunit)
MMKRLFPCYFPGIFLLGLLPFVVVFSQGDKQRTISEYELLQEKYQQESKLTEAANYQGKLGYLYWETGNNVKAIEYFQKAINNNETLGNNNAIRTLSTNIGLIYFDQNDFSKAIVWFRKSLQINQNLRKRGDIAVDYINISNALQGLKKFDESSDNILKALPIFQEVNDIKAIRNCYTALSENCGKLGQQDKAKEYFELAASINKQLQKEEIKTFESRTREAEATSKAKEQELRNTKDTLQGVIQLSYEKQMEIDLLNKAKELDSLKQIAREQEMFQVEQKRKNTIISMAVVLIIVLLFSTLIYRQLNQKKKANKLLEARNQQINEQKIELEKQHEVLSSQKKKITDSILYAQRIQNAVLPTQEEFAKAFPEHFVLFRPRDIVSGDFYWLTQKDGILILAVADCTGHGVPGAFMSMLGIAYLNEIVSNIGINKHIRTVSASDILNKLREYFINSLHQTGDLQETKDGMELSLCVIDIELGSVQFAGAHNPAYIVRDKELIKLEADKMPIGISIKYQPFTCKDYTLKQGDMLYLFSDGYYDQFGGEQGLKYFSSNFRKLLAEISTLSPIDQKTILEDTITKWRGSMEQIDDMLVIGIRILLEKQPLTSTISAPAKKRILIAEDTEVNYFLLVQALRTSNVQIFRAYNGKEAIDFCKTKEVDMVLMDINMPEMDGLEATMIIREFNQELPIIAQTALDVPGQKEKILEAGCNDYITKPIDLQLFLSIIKKYIEI